MELQNKRNASVETIKYIFLNPDQKLAWLWCQTKSISILLQQKSYPKPVEQLVTSNDFTQQNIDDVYR